MAKRNTNKNGKGRAPKRSSGQRTRNAVSAVDAGAAKFARMLVDPCNAPMGAPVYSGMGTGEYRRFRRIFNVDASAVEGTYSFQPSANAVVYGTHSDANSGLPYTLQGMPLFSNNTLEQRTETRCLAACVKVRYIGTEQFRSGVIGLQTGPSEHLRRDDSVVATDILTLAAVINRLGEVQHEVKFVPGAGDETFSAARDSSVVFTVRDQGSMTVSFTGIPQGALQFEVTAILEIEALTGMVTTPTVPTSRNTLNQVLGALGPPIRWAYGHVVAPTIRAAAGAAMNTITSGSGAVTAGRMLLTL